MTSRSALNRALLRALQLASNPADVTVVHVARRQGNVAEAHERLPARIAANQGPGIAYHPDLRVVVGEVAEASSMRQ